MRGLLRLVHHFHGATFGYHHRSPVLKTAEVSQLMWSDARQHESRQSCAYAASSPTACHLERHQTGRLTD